MSALVGHGEDKDDVFVKSAYANFMKPLDVEELVRAIRDALVQEAGGWYQGQRSGE